ncbi:MAG: glycosyltransferase [Desulfobacterales bacterium]
MDSSVSVSVVLPVHNRRRWIEEAVESVAAQTLTDFELIAVDDGSTDGTGEILSRYESRLRLIRQENRGVSAARNRGVAEARGRWIAFIDSDDLWRPEKLALQTAFFQNRPDARICQTEEIWVRNGIRVNPGRRHQKPSGDIFIPSLSLCLVSPSAVMMEKALFEEIGGFDESLPAAEDYDLWLRISARHPVHLIEEPLVVKRGGHADQLSRTPGIDRYRIRALEKILDSGELTAARRRAAAAVLREKCAIYAGGCRKRGRTAEAQRYEALAERFAPAGGRQKKR